MEWIGTLCIVRETNHGLGHATGACAVSTHAAAGMQRACASAMSLSCACGGSGARRGRGKGMVGTEHTVGVADFLDCHDGAGFDVRGAVHCAVRAMPDTFPLGVSLHASPEP